MDSKQEAAHWRRVVEWYADPEQWRVLTDDRGRDTLTFRWGDDGGFVARQALKAWGMMQDAASTSPGGQTGDRAETASNLGRGGAVDACG